MTTNPETSDGKLLEEALFEVKRVIVGQDRMVERMFTAVLARGHCLLQGVPGVAKTLAAKTLAQVAGGKFARLQFTPDLVPSDITGTRIYRQSSETFTVEPGPVVANFVLADEINRAPAKVQSALLEVMGEYQVSIGGTTIPVPQPFLVLATQNPIESEGVYQLPEAQRDRFLLKVEIAAPSESEELAILYRMSVDPPRARPVLTPERLIALQRAADEVFVHHAIAEYAVRLIVSTRELAGRDGRLAHGAGPRATLGLVAAARALALLRGRGYVLPEDVHDLAHEVIAHRLVMSFDALADGITGAEIVDEVLAAVEQPRVSPRHDLGPDQEENAA